MDSTSVKSALAEAGIEIYSADEQEIQIAERVRYHLMDSGIRVRFVPSPSIQIAVRTQQSDYPDASADDLFSKVRGSAGAQALARGYEEIAALSISVYDPVDGARVLDIWHEITYRKALRQPDETVEEVRWALTVDKYVSP